LDADYVIHAAAMPAGGQATADSIRSATRNALQAADDRECTSLVVPALGCGVAGFDLAAGAGIVGEELQAFRPEHLADVRFIAYGDDAYDTVTAATQRLR
jgi:O-acetyl-ADP-ribose deacetylase (regulator of RNase III)